MAREMEQENTFPSGLGDSEEEYNGEELVDPNEAEDDEDDNQYQDDDNLEAQDEEDAEEEYQPATTAQARLPRAKAAAPQAQEEEAELEIAPVSISDFRQYIPANMEVTDDMVDEFNTQFVENPGRAILSLMKQVSVAESARTHAQIQAASFMQQQAGDKYAGIVRDKTFGPLFQVSYASLPLEQQTNPLASEFAIMGAVMRRAQEVKGGLPQAFEEAAARISGRRLVDKTSTTPPPKKEILPPSQRTNTGAELATTQPVRNSGVGRPSKTEDSLSNFLGISKARAKTLWNELDED